MEREKQKACLGIITYAIALVLICIVIPEVVQNILLFAANADDYLAELQALLDQVTGMIGVRRIDLSELGALVNQYLGSLTQAINSLLPQILAVTSNVVSWIATAGLSLALSIYVMNGKERLLSQVRRCLRVYLPRRVRPRLANLARTVYDVFDGYVAGQCKEAVILGAYISGAVGVLLLLFVSPSKALLFLVFFIILQQMEGNIIYPKVVGHKIGLPGMWVLLAISVGGGLWGIWGMLISVPVITILYRLLRQDVRRRGRVLRGQREAF